MLLRFSWLSLSCCCSLTTCARAGGCAGSRYPFLTQYERDVETGLDYAQARYYGSITGRFISADPVGGHAEDPQTLNRYTYVRNSPLRFTDPSGLDFYLTCQQESSTCQNGQVGRTDKDGNFTVTMIRNDKNGGLVDQYGNVYTAKITGQGVSFNGAGSQEYILGVFQNGTNATTIQGSEGLTGFTFNFTESNLGVNQTAKGTWTFNGTYAQAQKALEKAGYENYFLDNFNIYHPSTRTYTAREYRSRGDKDTAANSGHFTVHEPVDLDFPDGNRTPKLTVPTTGEVHFGEHNPWVNLRGTRKHTKELTRP